MENLSPQFLLPGPANEGPFPFVLVSDELNRATAVVFDPEGDELAIVWDVPQVANPEITVFPQGGDLLTTLTLPREASFEGMLVIVAAIDQSPQRNTTRLTFEVEVP